MFAKIQNNIICGKFFCSRLVLFTCFATKLCKFVLYVLNLRYRNEIGFLEYSLENIEYDGNEETGQEVERLAVLDTKNA